MKKTILMSVTAVGLLMGAESRGEMSSLGVIPCPEAGSITVGDFCGGRTPTIDGIAWKVTDDTKKNLPWGIQISSKKKNLQATKPPANNTCHYQYATVIGGNIYKVNITPVSSLVRVRGAKDTVFQESKGNPPTPEQDLKPATAPKVDQCPKPTPKSTKPAAPTPPPPPPMPKKDEPKKTGGLVKPDASALQEGAGKLKPPKKDDGKKKSTGSDIGDALAKKFKNARGDDE